MKLWANWCDCACLEVRVTLQAPQRCPRHVQEWFLTSGSTAATQLTTTGTHQADWNLPKPSDIPVPLTLLRYFVIPAVNGEKEKRELRIKDGMLQAACPVAGIKEQFVHSPLTAGLLCAALQAHEFSARPDVAILRTQQLLWNRQVSSWVHRTLKRRMRPTASSTN